MTGMETMIVGGAGGGKAGGGSGRVAQEDPNTLQSVSTARILDLISEGEIGGLVNGAQSIFFDDTPLQNADGSYNFGGTSKTEYDSVATTTVGQSLAYATPYAFTVAPADQVTLSLQGSNIPDAKTVKLRIKTRRSGGAWIVIDDRYFAFKNGVETITLNLDTASNWDISVERRDSPAYRRDGRISHVLLAQYATKKHVVVVTQSSAVAWYERHGTESQSYIPGFPAAESEVSVGTEVKHTAPVTRTITESDADAVRVTLRVPQLTNQDTTNGDLRGSSVDIKIEVKPNGGAWITARTDTIDGKTVSPYERSYLVALPAGGSPWEVRVSRLTEDSASTALQNKTSWSSYTIITDAKLSYPGSAIIGMVVDARHFGSTVPTRSYDVRGILCKVPDNYDPVTRVYTGLWLGGFQIVWTDNPAWVLYDLLTNERYGLGGFIDAALVDKFALYAIAQYCDELIPDGFGGVEPRYTFNAVINSRAEAYKVIQSICSVFRGVAFWSTGAIVPVADMPDDVAQLIGPANVIDGGFTYSGTALKARHTAVLVSWNDPDDGYKNAIEAVEDADGIRQYGWRPVEMQAMGCASRGQAHRMGRWLLDTEKYQTETVTFRASFEQFNLTPYRLIKIADPTISGARHAGRLVAATTLSVTLDAPIDIGSGDTTLSVMLPDGTVADRPLTNMPGSATILTFLSPLVVAPQVGAMWMVTGGATTPRQFRVMALTEVEPNIVEVTALLHDPTKFARIEQNLALDPVSYDRLQSGNLPVPTAISHAIYLYKIGGSAHMGITFSWECPDDVRVRNYEVQVKRPGRNWENLIITPTRTAEVGQASFGTWSVRVRTLDGIGRAGAWLASDVATPIEGATPPEDVGGFSANSLGEHTYLSWDSVANIDIAFYRIKFAPVLSGASWSNAADLVPKASASATSVAVPSMIGTYLIKAVNTGGRESGNAALVVTSIASLDGLNVIDAVTESPSFTGTKTKCVIDGGLKLVGADNLDDWTAFDDVVNFDIGFNGAASEAIYEFAAPFDLGQKYKARLTPSISAQGSDISDLVDLWPEIDNATNWDGVDPSGWFVRLEVATTDDDPSGTPTWSAWKTLVIGDYEARAFKFRVVFGSSIPTTVVTITALSVAIDMPDRTIAINDYVCAAAGSTITFSPAFRNVPAIAIGAQGMATGDYYQITGKSAQSFTIRFFNSGGTGVVRTFDAHIKGYGTRG